MQYSQSVVPLKDGTIPEWRYIALLSEAAGAKLIPANVQEINDRELTRWYLGADSLVSTHGLSIAKIKQGGAQLAVSNRESTARSEAGQNEGASPAA
jgi:hypothetical protein